MYFVINKNTSIVKMLKNIFITDLIFHYKTFCIYKIFTPTFTNKECSHKFGVKVSYK